MDIDEVQILAGFGQTGKVKAWHIVASIIVKTDLECQILLQTI